MNSSGIQWRIDFFRGSSIVMRMDSHPERDPDAAAPPVLLLGGVIRNAGVEVANRIRGELEPQLGPFVDATLDDALTVCTMSEAGNLISSNTDHDKFQRVEGFQLTKSGRVIGGFEFGTCTFVSHMTHAIGIYTLEVLRYSYLPSTIVIPNGLKNRGKRVRGNP